MTQPGFVAWTGFRRVQPPMLFAALLLTAVLFWVLVDNSRSRSGRVTSTPVPPQRLIPTWPLMLRGSERNRRVLKSRAMRVPDREHVQQRNNRDGERAYHFLPRNARQATLKHGRR
jgi:hypothetical protein